MLVLDKSCVLASVIHATFREIDQEGCFTLFCPPSKTYVEANPQHDTIWRWDFGEVIQFG